jgi:hypothetical protein
VNPKDKIPTADNTLSVYHWRGILAHVDCQRASGVNERPLVHADFGRESYTCRRVDWRHCWGRKGAVEGYEAGRAASAAFFAEYGWVFLPLAMIISAALFGRLPGTTAKAPPLEKTLIYVDYTFAWHMAKSLTATVIISLLTLSQVAIAGQAYRLISAQNAAQDLTGENWINRIILLWHGPDGATTYVVYRALSRNAPWVEVARAADKDVKAFGGYENITDLAQTNDLCYKVDALNDLGQLVRAYESVCVPKFVPVTP